MLSSDFLPAWSHHILRITFCLSPSPSLWWVALLDLLSQAWGSMDGCPCSHGCFSSSWYGCSHSLVHSRASQLLSLPSHCAPRGCLPHLGSCSLALCYCLNIQRQASVKASVKCQEHKEKVRGMSVHSNMKPEKAWRYVRMPVPRLETTSIYRRRKNFNFKRKKCIPGVGIFQSVHWWFFTSWHFCQMYKQYCCQIIEISSPIAHPSSAPQLLFRPRCLWVCNAKQLELLCFGFVLVSMPFNAMKKKPTHPLLLDGVHQCAGQGPFSTASHVLTGASTGQPCSNASRMGIVTAKYQEWCEETLSHC